MSKDQDVLKAVRKAFAETISLKLQQFYHVVPKGSNPDLTGSFVEELVRGFVQQWIAPCLLSHGTLYPHDAAAELSPSEVGPKQIDGIVYDPRLGPAILREGNFLVVHPAFCRGVIEIKTSVTDFRKFEEDLQLRYRKYLAPTWKDSRESLCEQDVMGIVIQDKDPKGRRGPDWMQDEPLYNFYISGHCPIFILFKEQGGNYEPFEPAIDAMIKVIFRGSWQSGLAFSRIRGGILPP